MDEGLAASVPGPFVTKRARFVGPHASSSSGADPEMEVRALVSMASGLYPLARAEALSGLASVLKKVNASGGVVECCYGSAVKLLRDEDEGIRLAAVRLVGLCVEKFAMREELGGDGDQMDRIFLQLSSMARDMCTEVRIEAFNALAKMQRVSDGVLLQSLSKKIIKTDTGSASSSKGKTLPPKLSFPCAAGIFAHGIEDEFYQVRAVACTTLGALAKLSNQYAQKALDLLMDMMNDDTEAVRLQTLHTLFDMATYGSLSVHEKHMHMFLGILMDANVIVRNAARKILGSVNLPKLQMFKSAVDGLIAGLEKNPEDQDIYGVLFSIGKNHGSFSANIARHLAKEINMASDGELILDKSRTKALLMVSVSAAYGDKDKKLDIPTVIFSHSIPLFGTISCALAEDEQDSLLSYLYCQTEMPFWEKKLVSAEGGDYECFSVETVGGTHAQIGKTEKTTKYLDEVVIMQSTRLILDTVKGAWAVIKPCSIGEVQSTLRTCKEEVNILDVNSSGSTGAFLSFVCDYLDAVQLIVEIWRFVQLDDSHAFGPTSLDILLEKLDTSVRRMKCCYAGLNRELEVQVLDFGLLAILCRLSEFGTCSKLMLDKLHWIINHIDGLCADGPYELSNFRKEVKKVFDGNFIDDTPVVNICTFLEIFDLRPATDFGMLNATTAVLQVRDTNSENPLSYVCGLPVGMTFDISLCNISSNDRIWLRMVAGQSIRHVFLDLSCFEGNDEVKSCSTVIPFYATPMACSFVLRACLVIECPFGSIGTHQEGHGGPRDCVVQLCDELDVYFVSADTDQRPWSK
ncbi:protein SIEL [Hordeum vulgare subsp. vulgare]|uniref:Integrator complex subunit 4 n=1 Tax=Hordeum vulgare subsp. vulgare TaxID=112509 RepID=A0A8I6XR32_HORVV|nr:protein SIEL [Hordeum vulgare subsp. vulgare]